MEKESSGLRPVEANSTGGQGSRRAVAPSDDDGDIWWRVQVVKLLFTQLCQALWPGKSI
jgi:hypothetical protein